MGNDLPDALAHWRMHAMGALMQARHFLVAGHMSRECYLLTRRHLVREFRMHKALERAYYAAGQVSA